MDSAFYRTLGIILGLGLLLRLAYVFAQPGVDPTFNQPMLDGLLYVDWARNILAGQTYVGAYYLAPLYPFVLAGLFKAFGDGLGVVFLIQHLAVLGTAGMLGVVSRRQAGTTAGLTTAALVLLYPPLTFFASTPVAESIVLPWLALSLVLLTGSGERRFGWAGLVIGIAALGRPNLLLLPIAWAGLLALRSRYRAGLLLLAGLALVIAPVMLRNYRASGHAVPISANAGITAYHGNGPGATGVYTHPDGFSGSPLTQAQEATFMASRLSEQQLDAVDADRFWGREALRQRLSAPISTVLLLAKRGALLIDSHEHGLDYDPMLDRNPWRPILRLPLGITLPLAPLALILSLAAAGVFLSGIRATGGPWVWSALLACAATPILFYMSSRYRLPAAALLTIPAGCGFAALVGTLQAPVPETRRRLIAALVVAALWGTASLLVPSGDLQTAQRAQGLANLAGAYKQLGRPGDLEQAEGMAREALALQPESTRVGYNLATILEAQGRLSEAETRYRAVLRIDPGMVEAAGNLAALLIRRGSPGEAVSLLRGALTRRSYSATCWNNLVVALAADGRLPEARRAADQAAGNGVVLDPELLREIIGATGPGSN